MKGKKILAMGMVLCMSLVALAGCAGGSDSGKDESKNNNAPVEEPEAVQEIVIAEKPQLVIGSGDAAVKVDVEEKITGPEDLIAAIASETGWNLKCDSVKTENGKITIVFGSDSSLFTGPPEKQKDEYFVYDSDSLRASVLDSVAETLKQNLTVDGKTPEVYFTSADGGNMVFDTDGEKVTVAGDKAYTTYEEMRK